MLRAPMGTNATLSQILDPTLSGKPHGGGEGLAEGDDNTPTGVLDWSCQFSMVVAPMVYPNLSYVECGLSNRELLWALDAPVDRVKAATATELSEWSRELTLPFKVQQEVCEWVYAIVTQQHSNEAGHTQVTMSKAKCPAKEPIGPKAKWLRRTNEDLEGKPCSISAQGVSSNDTQSQQKAAKHDDAEVPVALWNDHVRQGSRLTLSDQELDRIRNLLLTY